MQIPYAEVLILFLTCLFVYTYVQAASYGNTSKEFIRLSIQLRYIFVIIILVVAIAYLMRWYFQSPPPANFNVSPKREMRI